MMDRITLETFVQGMLKRFAEAGDWGIDRRYVPSNILQKGGGHV